MSVCHTNQIIRVGDEKLISENPSFTNNRLLKELYWKMVVFIKKVFFKGGQSSINVFTFCDLQKVNLQWEFSIKVLKCKS